MITGGDHGGCGSTFEVGGTYVVFGWPNEADSTRNKVAETTYGTPTGQPQIRGVGMQTSICTQDTQSNTGTRRWFERRYLQ